MSNEEREPLQGEKQTGTCIYCGQTMMFDTIGVADKEQLDKWATEKCTCEKAKKMQEKVKAKHSAEENIRTMFRERYPEVEAIMQAALPYIEGEDVLKVTIDTGAGVKGSICMTSKGTIKVEMATSSKRAMEA